MVGSARLRRPQVQTPYVRQRWESRKKKAGCLTITVGGQNQHRSRRWLFLQSLPFTASLPTNFLLGGTGACAAACVPASAATVVPPLLALVVKQMAVPRCCPGEFGTTVGARSLGRLSRLFPLVPQKVAESRELPSVAAVLPALRLGPALHHPNVVSFICGTRAARGHDGGDVVHHVGIVAHTHRSWPSATVKRAC